MSNIKVSNKTTSPPAKVGPVSIKTPFIHRSEFQKIAIPAGLFCFLLIVNLLILGQYVHSPFAQVLKWDSELYWKWAQEIAGGNFLGNTIFHQSPLYQYFLAFLISLLGKNIQAVYIVQCVISACSTVLIYLISKKITNNRGTGVFASLLFALYVNNTGGFSMLGMVAAWWSTTNPSYPVGNSYYAKLDYDFFEKLTITDGQNNFGFSVRLLRN